MAAKKKARPSMIPPGGIKGKPGVHSDGGKITRGKKYACGGKMKKKK